METISDIIEEMRSRADAAFPADVDTMNLLEPLADRLEAAWEREKPGGNMAAMRKALIEIVDRAIEVIDDDEGTYRKIVELAQAALAEPARNCDMPHANDHELWLRWQNYCAEIWPRSISFSSWLLATAEEGGRDE